MIRATNQLTEKERKAAKALIASCQAYDQTFREPYLSNMLKNSSHLILPSIHNRPYWIKSQVQNFVKYFVAYVGTFH